jgi:NAD(P)-dependent dehydrogenase (short-subunit alcohol dehydrogenase family)
VIAGLDLTGRTCVITGAASGLGRESARVLAAAGAHVVLLARSREALGATEAWIRDDVAWARLTGVHIDLSSLASIRAAAATIGGRSPKVDILMNNAGVMFTPFSQTRDGFEMQFGTNYLGHFALTQLLTPQLRAGGGARVVNLASEAYRFGDVDLTDINWERRPYDKFRAYGASKTATMLHAVELDRRLREDGVRAYAVHPGMVATALARHMTAPDIEAVMAVTAQTSAGALLDGEVLTPDQGAATQVWAAVSAALDDVGGVYLADCQIRSDVLPYAVDPDRARALWALSLEACAAAFQE